MNEPHFDRQRVADAVALLVALRPWLAPLTRQMDFLPRTEPVSATSDARFGGTVELEPGTLTMFVDTAFVDAVPLTVLAAHLELELKLSVRRIAARERLAARRLHGEPFRLGARLEAHWIQEKEYAEIRDPSAALAAAVVRAGLESYGVSSLPYLDDNTWSPLTLGLPLGLAAEDYAQLIADSQDAQREQERNESQDQDDDPDDSDDESEPDDPGEESDGGGEDNEESAGEDDASDGAGEDADEDDSETDGQADSDDSEDDGSGGEPGGEDENESDDGSGDYESDYGDGGTDLADDDSADESDDGSGSEGPETPDGDGQSGAEDGSLDNELEDKEAGASSADQIGSSSAPTIDSDAEAAGGSSASGVAEMIDHLKEQQPALEWQLRDHLDKVPEDATDDLPEDQRDEVEANKHAEREDYREARSEYVNEVRAYYSGAKDSAVVPTDGEAQEALDDLRAANASWDALVLDNLGSAMDSAIIDGTDEYSYQVRNPNQPQLGPIMLGHHGYAPMLAVVIDVSGSMTMFMRRSLEAFKSIMEHVKENYETEVFWITVDFRVHNYGFTTDLDLSTVERISHGGRLGTDFIPLVQALSHGDLEVDGHDIDRPDAILVITDLAVGFSDEAQDESAFDSHVLFACVTPKDRVLAQLESAYDIPKWATEDAHYVFVDEAVER